MRPIKLTMTAFGPYKGKEVVDFRELGDRNLFLVTGPTGAGKTTIFDAISFAIYGAASGEMRSPESLRSHFASDELLTEVELEFELKGIRYLIQRIPKQTKLKARGEGLTEQKPEAKLTIEGGEPRTIIAGVNSVNERIEAILGINAEQFRQIMMIPQGEFQKLLTANSEDRQKVLQKLFDTGLYAAIQLKLEMQAKSLLAEIKTSKEIRQREIAKIETSEQETRLSKLIGAEDQLIEEILALTREQNEQDQQQNLDLEKEIKGHDELIEKLIKDREKARQDNEKLREKEIVRGKLTEKELATVGIERLASAVQQAERALAIVPLEQQYYAKQADYARNEKNIQATSAKIEAVKAQVLQAQADYSQASSAEMVKYRESLIAEITRLRSYEDKVSTIAETILSIAVLEQDCADLQRQKLIVEELITATNRAMAEARRKKDQAKDAEIMSIHKKEALENVGAVGKKLKKVLEILAELIAEQNHLKEAQDDLTALAQEIKIKEQRQQKSKDDLRINQAAILAQNLQDGTPCPVCGATQHLKLAAFSGQIVAEEALAAAEDELKKLETDYNNKNRAIGMLEERISGLMAQKTDLCEDLAAFRANTGDAMSLDAEKSSFAKLIAVKKSEFIELDREVKALDKIATEAEDLEKEISKLEGALKAAEQENSELIDSFVAANAQLTERKTVLQHIFTEVPEAIRDKDKLLEAIAAQEKLAEKARQNLEHARQTFEQNNKIYVTLVAQNDQLKAQLVDAADALQKAKKTLEDKISVTGFAGFAEFDAAKLAPEVMESHREQIGLHSREVHSLQAQYAELVEKTQGLQCSDVDAFETEIRRLRGVSEELARSRGASASRVKNNQKIVAEVEKINHEIGDREAAYNLVGNLAKVAKGDNPARITFERYVLAAFLEDIIAAANTRLEQMTGGRYRLSRTEELQRSNAKGGLELEVFDNYTGRARHVKTLSGGEGFKASLAMALGLADVVQAYAGGVQLDTMFIDEGFGTLDQESLDSAITCLIDLQKTGRLVGIISHVQELKERIETRLEVHSTSTGSETRFVGI
jgi:exonuclease SbcC